MKIIYWMAFCILLMCTSCSENRQNQQEVRLVNGNLTEIVLSPAGSRKNIEFIAESSWVATVRPVTVRQDGGNETDWLRLNQYSGGSGTNTLILMIDPNTTARIRMAEIVIQCGETAVSIMVRQEGREGDATFSKVKPIKQIKYSETDASGNVYKPECYLLTFSYDVDGNVAKIVQNREDKFSSERILTYTYGKDEIEVRKWEDAYEEIYRIRLNEKGLAEEVMEENSPPYVRFEYTEDGRLSKIEELSSEDENSEYSFSYEGGFLSQYVNPQIGSEGFSTWIDRTRAYINRYPNNGKIDMMGYLLNHDDWGFLFYIGRMGKTSDFMVESLENSVVINPVYQDIYDEPNVEIHQSYDIFESSDEPLSFLFEYDTEQNLTKLTRRMYLLKSHVEYDVIVGGELLDSRNPERGYVYEIRNRLDSPKERVYEQGVFEISY